MLHNTFENIIVLLEANLIIHVDKPDSSLGLVIARERRTTNLVEH